MLDVVGIVLGTVIVVDATSGAFDVTPWTAPALVGWAYLRAAFGLSVDNANTPKL